MADEVEVRQVPAQLALVVHTSATPETIGARMGEAFGVLMAHAGATGATFAGPPFGVYPEMPEGEFAFSVCMPVAPGATAGGGVELEEVPAVEAASLVHRGPYTGVGETWGRLMAWPPAHGRVPGGPAREVYLNDPSVAAPDELLTELLLPLA